MGFKQNMEDEKYILFWGDKYHFVELMIQWAHS